MMINTSQIKSLEWHVADRDVYKRPIRYHAVDDINPDGTCNIHLSYSAGEIYTDDGYRYLAIVTYCNSSSFSITTGSIEEAKQVCEQKHKEFWVNMINGLLDSILVSGNK